MSAGKGFGVLNRTDAERIADNPNRERAEKIMRLLEGHFPRRKYELVLIEHRILAIQVVDAYINIRVSERTITVVMGDFIVRTTQTQLFDVLRKGFEAEAKLRKTHSHQRQQIKIWLERLAETEMLETPYLAVTMNEFSSNPDFKPIAQWHWVGLPDDPVIEIRFMLYRNKWNGHDNFRVYFGDHVTTFNTIAELLSYFNGNDVFKVLDRSITKDNFQFITPSAIESEASWPKPLDPYVIIPRARLVQSTPHLLLMQANNPEILQGRVKPTVYNAHVKVEAAMQHFQAPAKTVDFVKFPCHPELQWDFHYAGEELEPEFGEDEDDVI